MSRRTRSSASLKSLVKKSNEVETKLARQVLVQSSPEPAALLASAVLCSSLKRAGHLFHFSVSPPLLDTDVVNELKEQHDKKSLLFVGVYLHGKKRLKKGTGYPLFIGGSCESEQAGELQIGDTDTTAVSSYAFASALLKVEDHELGLAAAGALLEEGFEDVKTKANQEIIEAASQAKLIEERKGIRLVGVDRLQLSQVLFSSTRPYLHGLSGNRASCDEALSEAEIPSTKFRSPVSELTTKEREKLVRSLVSRTDSTFLGKDFVLVNEGSHSPLRSVFETGAMLETAWSMHDFGTAFSVLLGDRGSSLRDLLDSQSSHNEEVVSIIGSLRSALKTDDKISSHTDLDSQKDSVLTDVGRIIFEQSLASNEANIISLSNKTNTEITWRDHEITSSLVLRKLSGGEHAPTTTSHRSVRFPRLAEEDAKRIMDDILNLKGRK